MGMYQYPRTKLFPTVQYSAKKDGNKQLSAHFKVKEFQSHDWADEIVICPYLIEGLERLFSYMNAKAINITSGYRTVAHSKAVGGSGATDNHHLGMAADIKVKKQDGTYYSAKQVACALQEIGWNYGIGLMSTSVHVDTLSKYWFDETKRQNGAYVCVADWHSYTGIAAPNSAPAAPATKPAASNDSGYYILTCSWLYIRTKPNGKKVGKMYKGTRFRPLAWDGKWCKIAENRWIYGKPNSRRIS